MLLVYIIRSSCSHWAVLTCRYLAALQANSNVTGKYPPTVFVHMPKDTLTAKVVASNVAKLKALVRPVPSHFFFFCCASQLRQQLSCQLLAVHCGHMIWQLPNHDSAVPQCW